jgi:hypothetical protein
VDGVNWTELNCEVVDSRGNLVFDVRRGRGPTDENEIYASSSLRTRRSSPNFVTLGEPSQIS